MKEALYHSSIRAGRILSTITLLAMGCFAAQHELTTQARRDIQAVPGVVLIQVLYDFSALNYTFKNCGMSGSGFLYRPDGYIITNAHVVQLARENDNRQVAALIRNMAGCIVGNLGGGQLSAADQEDVVTRIAQAVENNPLVRPQITARIQVYLTNKKGPGGNLFYRGEIKAYGNPFNEGGKDVAIIKIDGQNLPTLPIGNSDEVNAGNELTVFGYPVAAEALGGSELVPTITHGKVSAIKKDSNGSPVIQSDVVIGGGSSGGPALDANGRVVGISFASAASQGFNFFIPVNTVQEFTRQAGAGPASGAFDKVWSDALDAYQKRNWPQASDLLGQAAELMPSQNDIQRLKADAVEEVKGMSVLDKIVAMISGAGTSVQIGGGLVVVAILIAGFVLVSANKKNPFTPQTKSTRGGEETVIETGQTGGLGVLQIVNGPLKGKQYSIPQAGISIGRNPNACTVVLPGKNVSLEHAWVMPMQGKTVAVIDRSSTNGTFVNSLETDPIRKRVLNHGDRIFICKDDPVEMVYYRS